MSIVQVRQEIDDKLDSLDASMLKAIHTILYGPTAAGHKNDVLQEEIDEPDVDINGEPINLDELDEISNQMENGEGIPAEEVYKKAEQWLENSK